MKRELTRWVDEVRADAVSGWVGASTQGGVLRPETGVVGTEPSRKADRLEE